MADLYAKPYEVVETGYNPQQSQQNGQQSEMEAYLSSLPPQERQAAIERINAPLSGEELAMMANNDRSFIPTIEQFAEIEKFHKNHEISFLDGIGKIAEGGEQVMADLSNAVGSFIDSPLDSTKKMPATAVEAFAQGTRNFYGMLAQSQNPDSILFGVKDFLNGTGTIEDRYNQYIRALNFNRDSADIASGKTTLVMDKDMINPEITQAMSYIADPTLFVPFGKIASTGLRAVGLGEKLMLAGAKATAIKNGVIGGAIKWGAGQPLEFLGGAVRNTIDYGLEKGGQAFEATTGISGKEFAQTARMSGVGFSVSGIAGYAVPYASTISDAYIAGSSARGFGEALTLLGDTMKRSPFGRGINSWAAESLAQAEKNGVKLSPHAKGLLNVLNAVDPLFGYAGAVIEGSSHGIMIGGALGYASGGEEGMYHGMGAGMALGGVGGLAGKTVADVTGGTAVARRAVQAKMVIEGLKETNKEKAMFFQAMQKATEARGQDVDLVNGIIAGIDKVAPNFEFHAMTPEQFAIEGIRKGYDPSTGKFMEMSAIGHEFGGDRLSKSKAMYILRSVGGDFVGDSKSFLDALKRASARDSANPNKPASNIPSNLRKYIDVAKTFEKLSKTQQDAILKEIDGQKAFADSIGGKTKLREHYDALSWSEAWTDSLVKKFETDREGARKDIVDMLAQETKKNGELTKKGRALTDKLRAEGFLDREGKLLRERNLLQADMTMADFAMTKGGVIRRESDGKTHMYINLNRMGDETFPHELYHTIMRESPMKKHFTDSIVQKLLGVFDENGKMIREGEVNIDQARKFFQKYIDLTSRNEDGTLNITKADETMKLVNEAIEEYKSVGKNKKISDKARGLLEHYTEEFGAYYFSHWLMGRNRNTLFFGGELKGIEGLVERTKDAFLDFWQTKVSKANPEFDFSKGLNASFDRSEGLGRISSMDYFMRDMVRAASNANREVFRPDSMSIDNLRDFERSNGLRNLTGVDNNRRLNPREQVTQNIRLGKEAHKILTGLDKNLRTSKDTIDENGKSVITGRLSEAELDALVKGGIVPRAWADKVNQGYAMLDGTVSNVFSAGYLGKTEQTTDASYPRLTGKDVSFKNRKAVLFDVETKIKADGTFYTLFHTLDLAVIEQRGNHLWQNIDYRNLWNGDRGAMEADFFKYISNASKAGTDATKLDSAKLLEKGDGLGAKRRDVLQQMAGMALQTGDAYKHQPIAVIPEGIRHSVTTFNIDGLTMPRVESGSRYDINMGNAHKFIRENWQPDDMRQETTPNGKVLKHESGFKFSSINGKVTAFTSAGRKIGTYDNIKAATVAAKNEYNRVYNSVERGTQESVAEQNRIATKFQPLDENERAEAIRIGDVFALPSMRDFVGDRTLLRQTREEHIFQRALEAIENPDELWNYANAINDATSRIHLELDSYKNKGIELETQIKNIGDELNKLVAQREKLGLSFDYNQSSAEYAEYRTQYDNALNKREQLRKELMLLNDKIDDFEDQNKVALADNGLYRTLDFVKDQSHYNIEEQKKMFVERVKANVAMKDYSGLLENLFASDYDSKIQTGKPFVAVTTHGTKSVELMLSRLFAAEKLGSNYNIASSNMGAFSAGSQGTSGSPQYAKKNGQPDFSLRNMSLLAAKHSKEGKEIYERFDKKLMEVLSNEYDKRKEALDKSFNEYNDFAYHYVQNPHLGDATSTEKGDLLYKKWRSDLEAVGNGASKELWINSTASNFMWEGTKEPWGNIIAKDANAISKYVIDNNLIKSYPDVQMQLRKVIRMDNPYVVVDPRSYSEYHISPHMKRAIDAGHDGIIFKRFADGGERDNVYVVFKDFMKDNIKVIDTSFDDQGVPRGADETGRKLLGGKELKLKFQPDEPSQGGRVYDQNSKEWRTGFIGKYAEQNQDRIKNKNIEFVKRKDGSYRITMTDNSGETQKVGHITATIDDSSVVSGDGAAEISSNIDPSFRGNKLANVLYSEMAERLRAMGIKYVDGTIVNKDGIPVQVRNTIIGQTYFKGSNRPASREATAKKVQDIQSVYPNKGVGVYNELDPKAHYQPTEGSRYQGGDDYWKPKKNIFEYKDEQGLLVRRPYVGNSEITGDKDARGHQVNPADYNVRWDDIGHYPQIRETRELNIWELRNSGLWADDPNKGILLKNPAKSSDNTGYTHSEWFDRYQYDEDKPRVYGRYEMPRYGKDGELLERGKLSIAARYSDNFDGMAEVYAYKQKLAKKLGVNAEDIDAYYFGASAEQKASLGYGAKDTLPIKFQPAEGEKRIKQAAEKAWGMPIIEDATIAGLSSKKGYGGQFKSKSLLQGTFGAYKDLLDKSSARIDKYGWKMQDGKKVFDRKQYERERSNYEEKRNKFLKYLQENGGVENVKILDVVKGNLKEYGIDRDTNWMTPEGKGRVLTVDELFSKYEAEFNRELEENNRYKNQYEQAKLELDESPLLKTFQTGKPVAVKAFHGSPYGEIKGNSFAPEMLGKYTKAASAKNAYFFAGSERTSGAYIEGGKMSSFDAKVPYDGWLELDYTERDAVENALRELYQEYKKGGGRASEDSYAQSLINDKYQFRELVDATLGTETFSTKKIKKGQVFPFFVKFDNPLVFDQGGESYREKSYFDLIQQAKKEGRDGVIILDTKDGGEYDIIYAVLPSYEGNIKSAKPRTYDDSGKQIPIKQRFDTSSKDIRKQPAEGWRDWQSERTSVGSVIKNTAGYVIMVQKGKFKVYNPYKAMVGIYDSEEQAKRRVQKDEPRR